MVSTVLLFSRSGPALAAAGDDRWLTYHERSGGTRTPRYSETIAYCRALDSASSWVKYVSFGVSAQGRELPLLILSRDGTFEPTAAAITGKPIILIQSGIHAGEIDGKDASLMLARDIAIRKSLASLLDHAIILMIPIFNVDGHERFGPFNRINQNGPEEVGWRVTAQNLNLNRDFMKADTPEMRAFLTLFHTWLPDLYVDCHVTDGIDFQYDITYSTELFQNLDPALVAWLREEFLPDALPPVEAAGHRVYSYVWPREDADLSKGLRSSVSPPRFSTGYAALQNRPALLVETHMLKPYRTRVDATYHLLKAAIAAVNTQGERLRRLVREADRALIRRGGSNFDRGWVPLKFDSGKGYHTRTFLGLRSRTEPSEISGGLRTVYTGEPDTVILPFYDESIVVDSASIPVAYLIPPEWKLVPDVLRVHGIRVERLVAPIDVNVESYRFSDVRWPDRPFEGRFGPTYTTTMVHQTRTYPAGTTVVYMNQRTANVAVHLLEPGSEDSFVAWGFFNAIFEQKEYAENYVMEEVGRTMLSQQPDLRKEYERKLASDSSFAKNPEGRLNWLYLRSRWADPAMALYPVGRMTERAVLSTKP